MSFVPEKHRKYSVLMGTRGRNDWECLSYPCGLLAYIEKTLHVNITPYGYSSLDEYIGEIEKLKNRYQHDSKISALLDEFIRKMKEMNNKEEWSVLKFTGETDDADFGLTHGLDYYCPCSFANPEYEGIIDNEEFTSYMSWQIEPVNWKILEDPTEMAKRMFEKEYEKLFDEKYDNWEDVKESVIRAAERFKRIKKIEIRKLHMEWRNETILQIHFESRRRKLINIGWCHADNYDGDLSYEDLINDVLKDYTRRRAEYRE